MHFPATRWTAFGIHLLISAGIFLALLAIIVLLLFPGALFTAAGGWQGVRIIAGVDFVLGPLLTLVVYNVAKPRGELIRDLSIIGAVQIAALTAGMGVVYQQRPIAVTWVHDHFALSRQSDYAAAGERARDLDGFRWLRPAINYVALPDGQDEAAQIVAAYALSGEKIQVRSDLVEPLPRVPAQAAEVMRHNALAATPSPKACMPVRVLSRFGPFELCFDPASQRFDRLPGR